MAKSIRSKVKRANRSLHRKAVAQPVILKRQLKLAEELQKSINEKGGASIAGLKSVLNPTTPSENIEEHEDVKDEVVEEKKKARKVKITGLQQPANSNPKKELVWFK